MSSGRNSSDLSSGGRLGVVVQRLTEGLTCPICLEIAQLPVLLHTFRGCKGAQFPGGTCLRSPLCMHCANSTLQLDRPPGQRFPDVHPPGYVACLICRDTTVDARTLSPEAAYAVNHVLMDAMDLLDLPGSCRPCKEDFPSQAALRTHYLRSCPAAVVRCRFKGCAFAGPRQGMSLHETCCPIGRSPCGQCGTWIDKDSLLMHMVSKCRNRVVTCVLCGHNARLPELLNHLKLHQAKLNTKMASRSRERSPVADSASANTCAESSSAPSSWTAIPLSSSTTAAAAAAAGALAGQLDHCREGSRASSSTSLAAAGNGSRGGSMQSTGYSNGYGYSCDGGVGSGPGSSTAVASSRQAPAAAATATHPARAAGSTGIVSAASSAMASHTPPALPAAPSEAQAGSLTGPAAGQGARALGAHAHVQLLAASSGSSHGAASPPVRAWRSAGMQTDVHVCMQAQMLVPPTQDAALPSQLRADNNTTCVAAESTGTQQQPEGDNASPIGWSASAGASSSPAIPTRLPTAVSPLSTSTISMQPCSTAPNPLAAGILGTSTTAGANGTTTNSTYMTVPTSASYLHSQLYSQLGQLQAALNHPAMQAMQSPTQHAISSPAGQQHAQQHAQQSTTGSPAGAGALSQQQCAQAHVPAGSSGSIGQSHAAGSTSSAAGSTMQTASAARVQQAALATAGTTSAPTPAAAAAAASPSSSTGADSSAPSTSVSSRELRQRLLLQAAECVHRLALHRAAARAAASASYTPTHMHVHQGPTADSSGHASSTLDSTSAISSTSPPGRSSGPEAALSSADAGAAIAPGSSSSTLANPGAVEGGHDIQFTGTGAFPAGRSTSAVTTALDNRLAQLRMHAAMLGPSSHPLPRFSTDSTAGAMVHATPRLSLESMGSGSRLASGHVSPCNSGGGPMLSAGMGIGARVLAAQLSRGSDKGQLGRMVGLRRSMSDSQALADACQERAVVAAVEAPALRVSLTGN